MRVLAEKSYVYMNRKNELMKKNIHLNHIFASKFNGNIVHQMNLMVLTHVFQMKRYFKHPNKSPGPCMIMSEREEGLLV